MSWSRTNRPWLSFWVSVMESSLVLIAGTPPLPDRDPLDLVSAGEADLPAPREEPHVIAERGIPDHLGHVRPWLCRERLDFLVLRHAHAHPRREGQKVQSARCDVADHANVVSPEVIVEPEDQAVILPMVGADDHEDTTVELRVDYSVAVELGDPDLVPVSALWEERHEDRTDHVLNGRPLPQLGRVLEHVSNGMRSGDEEAGERLGEVDLPHACAVPDVEPVPALGELVAAKWQRLAHARAEIEDSQLSAVQLQPDRRVHLGGEPEDGLAGQPRARIDRASVMDDLTRGAVGQQDQQQLTTLGYSFDFP